MSKITTSTAIKRKSPRKIITRTVARKSVEAAPKKLVAKKKNPAPQKSAPASTIQSEERNHMIQIAAFYIAERRAFQGGSADEDWLQAEREIDAMITAGKFTS